MFEFSDIITSLLFIFLHFFLFLFNYKIMGKKAFQPAVLFSFLWFAIILLHFFFRLTILDELAPLSAQTYLIFLIGTLTFSIGSFLVVTMAQKKQQQIKLPLQADVYNAEISFSLRLIFTAIIIVGLPLYIKATYRVFIASQIDDFFAGVRTAITYYDEDIGPTKYLLSFSFVVFGINLFSYFQNRNWRNRAMLLSTLLVALTYAVLATGRTFFLILLGIYLGVSYVQNRKASVRKYFLMAAGFLFFFMAIGLFWGKTGDTKSSVTENLRSSTEVTATYLVLSLNALDYETSHYMAINYNGDNTLRFFIKVGQQFGLVPNRKVSSLIKEFLFLPYGTNVYTVYSDYIKDFGRLYAWLMLGLFGALHTWLHNKAVQTKSIRFVIYFSFMLYPLLMTFFQDTYLSLLSTWLQVIFYVETFMLVNKYLLRRQRERDLNKIGHGISMQVK